MSIWNRVFGKNSGKPRAAKPLSLTELYQRKLRRYLAIAAAGNAALKTLARLQAEGAEGVYFTPAYVQLLSEMAWGQAREAVRVLQEFQRRKDAALPERFADLAGEFREARDRAVAGATSGLALATEGHTLPRVEVLASGVAYPAEAREPEGTVIITGGWGWGAVAEEPMAGPWCYQVDPQGGATTSLGEAEPQTDWLAFSPAAGWRTETLPGELQGQAGPAAAELRAIAALVAELSLWAKEPQEVLWVLGPGRELVVLRSAPRAAAVDLPDRTGETQESVFISGGVRIYPGQAAGPALPVAVDKATDPETIPAGSVLLTAAPSPTLAPLLPRAGALVAATGQAHNHLAFLAREARVPAIFNIGAGLSRIAPGTRVEVDARNLTVRAGGGEGEAAQEESRSGSEVPVAPRILQDLSPYLFPRDAAGAMAAPAPENCRSLHDLLREVAMVRVQEMFTISLRAEVSAREAVSLVTGRLVPILVIDGGGGLAAESPQVDLAAVTSAPFRVFLEGMMSIPWPKARPLDVKGFISVVGVTATTPQAEDQLRKVSFALISRDYMNFSLCLGYHASTIEAYMGENLDDNYIRFHYQGGAASLDRRLRRLQLIGGILTRLGFTATLEGDLLDGMAKGDPEPVLLEKLAILGRLEVYTKQMDMVMADDDLMYGYIEDFFAKHVKAGPPVPETGEDDSKA